MNNFFYRSLKNIVPYNGTIFFNVKMREKNRIIKVATLKEFWEKHPTAKAPLESWYDEAKKDSWKTTTDIRRKYRTADFLKGDRVVFNIGGNKFRLIVKIEYKISLIFIRFIGTHAEYDKVDAETI